MAYGEPGDFRAVRLQVHPETAFVVLVPPDALPTTVARGLLPESVPHADAVRNAGRAALLVAALTICPDRLLAATEDRLHQQYRAPAMPASTALIASLRREGIAAVVSGAGPSVLAMGGPGRPRRAGGPGARRLAGPRAGRRSGGSQAHPLTATCRPGVRQVEPGRGGKVLLLICA